jgi:hypothetical protein
MAEEEKENHVDGKLSPPDDKVQQAWGTPRGSSKTKNGEVVSPSPVSPGRSTSKDAKEVVREPEKGVFGAVRDLAKVEVPQVQKRNIDAFPNYKQKGTIARIARSPPFEYVTLGVIAVNAIWIGADTQYNDKDKLEDSHIIFQGAENMFCIYFSAEVVIRFWAFHTKRLCLTDAWFMFDSGLVFFIVLETWLIPLKLLPLSIKGSGPLRLLRLLRLTRMARLMRSFPDLLTLVKGMIAATRSVGSTLLLLMIFNYVFAIVFTGQLKNHEHPDFQAYWGTLFSSMFTLILAGTLLDDITTPARDLIDDGQNFLVFCIFVYILLSNFTMLNMLIGVLCEVVSCTKQGEEERAVLELVREKIEGVMDKVDKDGSGMISRKEFDTMLEGEDAPIVLAALEEIDVESKHLLALSDSLFELDDDEVEALKKDNPGKTEDELREEGKELSFSEFLKTLCHLRPENNASVMDVAEVRKMMRRALRKTEQKVEEFEDMISRIEEHGLPHTHVEAVRRLLGSTKEVRDKVLMETQRAEAAEQLVKQLQGQLDALEAEGS